VCARIMYAGSTYKPGDRILIHTKSGYVTKTWGGEYAVPFAREQTLNDKWLARGWQECLITVDDFAERHHRTNDLVWRRRACELRAVTKGDVVAVVTRPAAWDEWSKLGHDRHPVLAL